MGYRRMFIIRKDLHLSSGKLATMVGHCAESYWTRLIRSNAELTHGEYDYCYNINFTLDKEIMDDYINGSFVKTICQARNKNHLLKAKTLATELGITEGVDFGGNKR